MSFKESCTHTFVTKVEMEGCAIPFKGRERAVRSVCLFDHFVCTTLSSNLPASSYYFLKSSNLLCLIFTESRHKAKLSREKYCYIQSTTFHLISQHLSLLVSDVCFHLSPWLVTRSSHPPPSPPVDYRRQEYCCLHFYLILTHQGDTLTHWKTL